MLSELDAYKQKQSAVSADDIPQEPLADTENLSENGAAENGEERK